MPKPDAAHLQTDKELAKLEKRIAKIYKEAADDLQKTIDDYFAKFAKRDAKQKARLDAGEITEQEYKQWRLAQMGRGERFKALQSRVAERYTEANKTAVRYVNDATPGIYSLNRNYSAYTIEKVAGNVGFDLWDEQTVKRLIVDNPELMPYYPPEKALNRGIDLAYGKRQISACVTSSILQGKSIKGMADDLQTRIPDMNRTSAIRTARTAVTGAQNAGRMDSYVAAEKMGIKVRKEWLATIDGRTRHSHAMLDGKVVDKDKKFGNGCMFPGDPNGPPWEVYNCRCTLIASVDGVDTTTAQRRVRNPETGKNELVSDMTYQEWAGWKVKVKTAEFIPAKTVDEAEEYALKFVDQNRSKWSGNVSFKGISVESANTINKTLDELYSTGRLPKLRNIKPMNFRENIWKGSEEAPMAYRNMGDGDLYFNPRILKNKKTVDKYFLDGEKAYRFCVENIDKVPESKRHLVETYSKAGRSLVAQSADDKLSAVVQHEIGHHIQNQIIWKDKNAAQIVNDGFEKYSVQISGYATKTKGEYIAESFCSFKNGESEKIDPKLLEFFEGIV